MRRRWLVVIGLGAALAACGKAEQSSDTGGQDAAAMAPADGGNPGPDSQGVATEAHAVTPPSVEDDAPPPHQEAKP
jgi:hypothetical protein